MKNKNDVGELYREKFKDYSPEPSPRVWENVQSKVVKPSTPIYKFMMYGAAAFVAITAIVLSVVYFSTTDEITPQENKEKLLTSTNQGVEYIVSEQETPIIHSPKSLENVKEIKKENNMLHENIAPISPALPATQSKEILLSIPIKTEEISNVKKELSIEAISTSIPVVDAKESIVEKTREKIYISKDTIVCENSTATLSILNADHVLWNNGQSSNRISVNVEKSETFSVSFTNEYNKDTTAYIFVRCVPCTEVTIPTAFTPNGDGLNDVFKVYVSGELESFEMIIFASNNTQVFRTSTVQKGWDGMYKGVLQAHGLYFYAVRYKDNLNQVIEKKGEFLLLKN